MTDQNPSHEPDVATPIEPAASSDAQYPIIPPASPHGNEEEDAFYDADSAVGSLLEDDTQTLQSHVARYRYENNRRYHNYGSSEYWGPNDEAAQDQIDFAHHMYLMTLDGELHLAPIGNPQRILDLGTGTGIWAIDMAERYPSAVVTGNDLSPIQPNFGPPNCSFEVDDINLPWAHTENSFDFIHVRELFGSVADWDTLFQEIKTHLKPGGWVEVIERSIHPRSDDDTVGPDHFYNTWGKTVLELGNKMHKTYNIWEESKDRLVKAGFTNVTEVRYKWPMNHWPKHRHFKEIGRWNQLRMTEGLEGFMIRLLTSVGGWSYERAQVFLAQMRQELKDTKTHAFLDLSVVYAQKPA